MSKHYQPNLILVSYENVEMAESYGNRIAERIKFKMKN